MDVWVVIDYVVKEFFKKGVYCIKLQKLEVRLEVFGNICCVYIDCFIKCFC